MKGIVNKYTSMHKKLVKQIGEFVEKNFPWLVFSPTIFTSSTPNTLSSFLLRAFAQSLRDTPSRRNGFIRPFQAGGSILMRNSGLLKPSKR
jgi:hypothetical protein